MCLNISLGTFTFQRRAGGSFIIIKYITHLVLNITYIDVVLKSVSSRIKGQNFKEVEILKIIVIKIALFKIMRKIKKEKIIMKKSLIALGILMTLAFGAQSSFAACPCAKVISPCPCAVAQPCLTGCAAPCATSYTVPYITGYAAPCASNCGCNNCCREKCSWWKIFQNKNCCTKCNKCCDCCD